MNQQTLEQIKENTGKTADNTLVTAHTIPGLLRSHNNLAQERNHILGGHVDILKDQTEVLHNELGALKTLPEIASVVPWIKMGTIIFALFGFCFTIIGGIFAFAKAFPNAFN